MFSKLIFFKNYQYNTWYLFTFIWLATFHIIFWEIFVLNSIYYCVHMEFFFTQEKMCFFLPIIDYFFLEYLYHKYIT